jgi:recombination DNA repair RAD52 pathway protein
MAGPRINQFADDLGVSRSSAKKLLKKARGRKDGGSETLKKYSPEMQARLKRFEDAERIFKDDTKIGTEMSDSKKKKKMPLPKKHPRYRDMGQDKTKDFERDTVEAKDGKYMACGGYGKATQGTKFTGVK